MTVKSFSHTIPYQVAELAAGEAVDAVLSVFWADSFEMAAMEACLAETIYGFIKGALPLEEPHPAPKRLEQDRGYENIVKFCKRE